MTQTPTAHRRQPRARGRQGRRAGEAARRRRRRGRQGPGRAQPGPRRRPHLPEVPVPYSGQAPVVMINGQQVPAGQAVDISAMLGGFFGGATRGRSTTAATAPRRSTIPPVVTRQRPGGVRRPARRPVRSSSGPRWPPRSAARSSSSAWTARSAGLFGGPAPTYAAPARRRPGPPSRGPCAGAGTRPRRARSPAPAARRSCGWLGRGRPRCWSRGWSTYLRPAARPATVTRRRSRPAGTSAAARWVWIVELGRSSAASPCWLK